MAPVGLGCSVSPLNYSQFVGTASLRLSLPLVLDKKDCIITKWKGGSDSALF